MNRFQILAVFLITIFLMQCSRDTVSPENSSDGFFPMEIGNKWNYHSIPEAFSVNESMVEIINTTEIGGKTYFVFERTYPNLTTHRDTSYFRKESNKVFINWNGEEFLYIDFDRDVNDSWETRGSYIGVIQDKNKRFEVPAGIFTNATLVYFDIPLAADAQFCEHYAKGVGRLNICCLFGIPMELVSATISGKKFPE
mgnify:CR=1 FL=1